ncbi:hypothetical protein BT93_L0658 [Corymbia citriodora subsp. variegata]|uniref:Wall-associated receptor kinase galacturonan-binding domain-containing protein n=1 Tax=Corymbia citriodora subsp. variegata TaxID=360336 RepID=A0A8T0CPF0_CORYI|nr:hypothetical protein BT93_L0658 [Corymbia citriodora subsp. variegata]
MHKDQLLVLILLLLPRSLTIAIKNNQCATSYSEIANISYPFRLKGDPKDCGHNNYELVCINNHTILDLNYGQYYVRSINYTNYMIRVVDVGLPKDNCSSLSLHSLLCSYFSFESDWYDCWDYGNFRELSKTVSFVNCTKAVGSHFYVDTSSCLDGPQFSNFSSMRMQLYAMVNATILSVEIACTIEFMAIIPWWVDGNNLCSFAQIHKQMVYGFELTWRPMTCEMDGNHIVECEIYETPCKYKKSKDFEFVQFSPNEKNNCEDIFGQNP